MVIRRHSWDRSPEITWQKHCGFLDYSPEEFNNIQRSLLMDQLQVVHKSPLGRRLLCGGLPQSIDEFRYQVPLTKYGDYLPDLDDSNDAALAEPAYQWVHTTGARAEYKHIPYTRRGYEVVLNNVMAAFILSCARRKGEVNLQQGDRALYNTPPRPFLSGLITFDMADRFGFAGVMGPEEAEEMEFKERIEKGFKRALPGGVDVLVSMSSILVKIGEEFEKRQKKGSSSRSISRSMFHPATLTRLGKGLLKSKISQRGMLPKDLWCPKGILAWGIDAPFFKAAVEHYWGCTPFQFYSCTEGGVMAMQGWNKQGMTLIPYSNFFEFIPEDQSIRSWDDPDFEPDTLLPGDLEAGKRYELVITNFYGMPLLRYRVGHLIRVISLEDAEIGVRLPQIEFEARCDDRIDIAGFTRIDEKTFWEALGDSELGCADWIVRKEPNGAKPVLHLYGEFSSELTGEELANILDRNLKDRDPFYQDLQQMLGIHPLRVTRLPRGAFDRYYELQMARGAPLADRRPARMNATNADVVDLLRVAEPQVVETPLPDRARIG